MEQVIPVSTLNKTWIFDIDGTLCKHNGYKTDGFDTILPGAKNFFDQLPADDKVILVTSRKQEFAEMTERFLKVNGLRYDAILYDMPCGERILVNDKKPSGMITGIAVNTDRNVFLPTCFREDPSI